MNLTENKKEMTDQAWKRLYSRMEQEKLLPKKTMIYSTRLKWAAAVAVLCICIASALTIRNYKYHPESILSLNNNKNGPALVSALEDGSVVYLSDYTSLQYPNHFSENKRQVFLQGDAFFDISKNPERPFIIETTQATIEVLGTAFNVKSRNDTLFSLSVKHGKVKVTSRTNGQSVLVKAGETALLKTDHLQTMQTKDTEQFEKYTRQMHFKDQQLSDIIRIINLNSDSVLLKVSPDIGNRILTVSFSGDTPYSMAQLICMSLNLQFIQQQNTIFITEPK